MRKQSWPLTLTIVGLIGTALMGWHLAGRDGAARAQAPEADAWKNLKYFGADACKRCHCAPLGSKTDFVRLDEYTIWRTQDKHSIAYLVLEGPRGQQMGQLLAGDPKYVLKPEAGCLNCHAMHFPGREGSQFSIKDGVSCDGCHGPSQEWIGPHAADFMNWRKKSSAEKYKLGMRDLRDPAVRSELCLSCHVGNASEGKVVTHAMYAAGHPPLPGIEVAAFSINLPQHFFDLRDTAYLKDAPADIQKQFQYDTADFQNTRLAMISCGLALQAQAALAADRANLASAAGARLWPELTLASFADAKDEAKREAYWPQFAMAHSDCYACHHELMSPSWRQRRGPSYLTLDRNMVLGVAGRPQVRPWPLAPFDACIHAVAPASAGEFRDKLTELYKACNVQPFGEPRGVQTAGTALADWTRKTVSTHLVPARIDQATALQLMRQLGAVPQRQLPDWDTARQLASLLQVIHGEWSRAARPANEADARKIFTILGTELDIWVPGQPDEGMEKRKKLFTDLLEKLSGRKVASDKELQQAVLETDPDKLKDAALAPQFLRTLQDLRNQDYIRTSQRMSEYNPDRFRRHLDDLLRLLPER